MHMNEIKFFYPPYLPFVQVGLGCEIGYRFVIGVN